MGNVLAVITDRKRGRAASGTEIQWFDADVVSAQQYYPFGMLMPGNASASLRRQYSLDGADYRFGFNGKEGDDEVKGDDNQQDYGMRIYDPRAGRFLSVDPIAREYPMLTPYQFASNRPIDGIDLDGLEYLRFDKVSRLSNTLLRDHYIQYSPVVEYKGTKYYNIGSGHTTVVHLTDIRENRLTEWIYTPIDPVIPEDDYVGYGDVTPRDCMVASKAQVAKQNLEIGNYTDAIQLYKSGKRGHKVTKESKLAGIDAIQKSLELGKSIIVGVDYTRVQKANKDTDNTTDHFITIVGRGNDSNGEFFSFYENAISNKEEGTDVLTNRLYLQGNGNLKGKTTWGDHEFRVTQVRPTKEKEEK